MRNNTRKGPFLWLLDALTALLCLALVGAAIFAFASFRDSGSFTYDADSFYYRLSDEDFSQLVEMYHMNQAAGVEEEELEAYHAIARYFEAASYCKAYAQAGDSEKQAHYQALMDSAKADMGELLFVSEKIDRHLGL